MRKPILSLGLAALLATPTLAAAQAAAQSPHSLAGNVGLFSSYRFRGIDQTFGKPALLRRNPVHYFSVYRRT